MKIDLSAAPHRVDDLLRFLRSMGYAADEVDYAVVEVQERTTRADSHVVALALALQLGVWNAVNDAEARIV